VGDDDAYSGQLIPRDDSPVPVTFVARQMCHEFYDFGMIGFLFTSRIEICLFSTVEQEDR
jgi:hypothetical protein